VLDDRIDALAKAITIASRDGVTGSLSTTDAMRRRLALRWAKLAAMKAGLRIATGTSSVEQSFRLAETRTERAQRAEVSLNDQG